MYSKEAVFSTILTDWHQMQDERGVYRLGAAGVGVDGLAKFIENARPLIGTLA